MDPNLRPPHRHSRSLARPPEAKKEMWRAYLIATDPELYVRLVALFMVGAGMASGGSSSA